MVMWQSFWVVDLPDSHKSVTAFTGGEMHPLSYHQNGVPTPDAGNCRRSHMELGQQQQGLCVHGILPVDVKVMDILRNVLHF